MFILKGSLPFTELASPNVMSAILQLLKYCGYKAAGAQIAFMVVSLQDNEVGSAMDVSILCPGGSIQA